MEKSTVSRKRKTAPKDDAETKTKSSKKSKSVKPSSANHAIEDRDVPVHDFIRATCAKLQNDLHKAFVDKKMARECKSVTPTCLELHKAPGKPPEPDMEWIGANMHYRWDPAKSAEENRKENNDYAITLNHWYMTKDGARIPKNGDLPFRFVLNHCYLEGKKNPSDKTGVIVSDWQIMYWLLVRD
jgi:hypothetical protein